MRVGRIVARGSWRALSRGSWRALGSRSGCDGLLRGLLCVAVRRFVARGSRRELFRDACGTVCCAGLLEVARLCAAGDGLLRGALLCVAGVTVCCAVLCFSWQFDGLLRGALGGRGGGRSMRTSRMRRPSGAAYMRLSPLPTPRPSLSAPLRACAHGAEVSWLELVCGSHGVDTLRVPITCSRGGCRAMQPRALGGVVASGADHVFLGRLSSDATTCSWGGCRVPTMCSWGGCRAIQPRALGAVVERCNRVLLGRLSSDATTCSWGVVASGADHVGRLSSDGSGPAALRGPCGEVML